MLKRFAHRKEFTTAADVHLAFEHFLCATKGSLTASEIAKIRDTVGVIGMAGVWYLMMTIHYNIRGVRLFTLLALFPHVHM